MLMTRLRSAGRSVMFTIPKAILDGLHTQPKASVGFSIAQGKLIVDPHPRHRHTLAELLEQCDPDAPRTAEDVAWLADGPAGREDI